MIDLTNVKASSGRLPVGGYICTITKAQDVPHDEYIEVVYDIAEGEYKGFYEGEDEWKHTTRRYYKGNAAGMLKAFLETVAKDNPKFNVDEVIKGENVKGLVGCQFGALIQTRLYTKQDGSDGEALEVARVIECEKIRTGNYTLPQPRDGRRNKDYQAVVDADSLIGDAPF